MFPIYELERKQRRHDFLTSQTLSGLLTILFLFKIFILKYQMKSSCRELKLRQVRDAFMSRIYINRFWSVKLMFCEFLNFLHVILQVYITNEFLSGNFYRLGSEIWNEGFDSNVDVLDEVFPKVNFTKEWVSFQVK